MEDLFAQYGGVDTTGADTNQAFDPIPEGKYQAIIRDYVLKPGPDSLTMNVEYVITEGTHKGRRIFDFMTIASRNASKEGAVKWARGRIAAMEKACGLPPGRLDTSKLDKMKGGSAFVIDVKIKPARTTPDGRNYDASNEVKAVYGPQAQQAPVQAQSAMPQMLSPAPAPLPPAGASQFPAMQAPAGYSNPPPAAMQQAPAANPAAAVAAAAGPVPAFMQAMAPMSPPPPAQAWTAPQLGNG